MKDFYVRDCQQQENQDHNLEFRGRFQAGKDQEERRILTSL